MFQLRGYLKSLAIVALTLFAWLAFAQEAPPEVPNADFLNDLVSLLGGAAGLKGLALVAACVQLLVKLVSTPMFGSIFKNLTGGWKLVIVSALTLIGGVISQMVTGQSLLAAVTSSTALLSISVLIHQIIKQTTDKPKA